MVYPYATLSDTTEVVHSEMRSDGRVNGIWLATPAAELMALALSVAMFLKYRKRYGY